MANEVCSMSNLPCDSMEFKCADCPCQRNGLGPYNPDPGMKQEEIDAGITSQSQYAGNGEAN